METYDVIVNQPVVIDNVSLQSDHSGIKAYSARFFIIWLTRLLYQNENTKRKRWSAYILNITHQLWNIYTNIF